MLFDLDGVLTPTVDVHRRAWRALFDDFFSRHAITPPYTDEDYTRHIDGRPRFKGVAAVLASRSITLPAGTPADPPEAETIAGLGNRKNAAFLTTLMNDGVTPYPGTASTLDELARRGVLLAVVSSSVNAGQVLKAAGLDHYFPVVVDGRTVEQEGLPGKPAPDTFLRAAELLGTTPKRTAVLEDAVAGVQAASAGDFVIVLGVDRGAGADRLLEAGAHAVVTSLPDALTYLV
ncbi:MAG: beta-phosphoglucomutase family hydrolase [Micrococcales bacterium]|nr:beta-phosphoglucomutase family hydrolase [Micrococcales bacterium]